MITPKRSITDRIAEMSESFFSEHELELRSENGLFRSWRCQNPRGLTYGFDITTTPGWIFIHGDIGHLVLTRNEDMLPWVRGLFNGSTINFSYIDEKVPLETITREWCLATAVRHLEDHLADVEVDEFEKRAEYMDRARGCEDQNEWDCLTSDMVGDFPNYDYPPNGKDWSPRFLWCVFGLRRFIRLLDSAESRK